MTRTLTPLGWLIAGIAVLMAVALIAWGWNNIWAWLPWSAEARLDRAEARVDRAEGDASARGLEAQGNAEQVRRTEAYGDIRVRVEAATAESITQARSAPDATDPIAADRAARLRDHDRQLCVIAPASCPTAAPDAP